MTTLERNAVRQNLMIRGWRASWRLRNAVNFVAAKDDTVIPMRHGIGLQLIDEAADIAPLLNHFYRAGCRGTVVDIGANIGLVLLTLLQIDRDIKYIGFEPSIQAAAYVQDLIDRNGLAATHAIYPVALSDNCGAVRLHNSGSHDVSATIDTWLRPDTMYKNATAVCTSTGDTLLRNAETIDIIKIDVEGNECRVLIGLAQTIQRHQPALILEIMPHQHLEDGTYPKRAFGHLTSEQRTNLAQNRRASTAGITQFLAQNDYALYRLRNGTLAPADPSETTPSDQDFVALPAERLSHFGVSD